MRSWLLGCSYVFAVTLLSPAVLLAADGEDGEEILSRAKLVAELSDDFENPQWSFDPEAGVSSNGLWKTGMRGAPETCERVAPAHGGLPGQEGALLLRTVDQDDDGWPRQEDLVTRPYDKVLDHNLERASLPVLTARLYVPPIDEEGPAWSVLGLRVEARSTNEEVDIPRYYPSLWVVQYNQPDEDKVGNYLRVRLGDGHAPDHWIGELGGPGWYTLGLAFDAEGVGHYFARKGVEPLTLQDKVYET
ncbi:MAG: hypothetical protein ACOC1G_09380, partial [Phycisphaeraceae bacterium]